MENTEFKAYLNEIRDNFKIAVDDLFNAIEIISANMDKNISNEQKPKELS